MRPHRMMAALVAILTLASAATVLASLVETENGVWVDDFEDGMLLDWEPSAGTDAEVSERDGNSVLEVSGAGQVTLADMKFSYFAAELTLKGGEGGLGFGGKYQALLTTYFGGSLRVTEKRKGELALLKRGYQMGRSHRLKVVCSGSLIRVYVDGRREFEKADASPVEGTIVLVAGQKGALLDDVRISTKLSPEEGAMAVPVEEDQALVFSSEADAKLHLKTANGSARKVSLVASVRRFKATPVPEPGSEESAKRGNSESGLVVKYGTKFYYSIEALPGKPVSRAETALKAKSARALDLNLGRNPPGFYLLDLSFVWGGKEHSHRKCPLAVFKDTAPVEYQPPVITVGTYTHKMPKAMKEENPLWWNTHVHAVALMLKQHNLNAVVACGAYEPDTIEIFQRYGISVLERGEAHLDHPGVIGTLIGDEPHAPEMDYYKAQYEAAQKKTDKPVMTTCIGEGIGLGGKYPFWREINPRIRAFRWYGIKKHFYGIRHHLIYKGTLPFTDVLRIAYASFDTPYWIILPSNGDTNHEAYFQYPSPAQHRGLMHLTMAYGAKGIVFYSLQAGFGVGLVDTVTLKPNGGNLAAIGEVAGHIKRHAKLIRSLEVGKLDVRCASPDVEPVPLHDGKDGRYVYAISRNTKESVSCKLFWPRKLKRNRVRDIFADARAPTEADEFYVSVPLELAPGEGRLLAVSEED